MEATESPGFFKRLLMNPLVVRELRVACRSWKLVIILSAYLLIQGAIFAIWLYAQSNSKGMYEDPTGIGSGLFTTLSVVLVIVVMLVFPAFSSTAIASEHERKSFDLLLLTPLSPWEIAIGKFFAAATQASIFLISTVPLFAMASLFGGIDPGVFFVILWMLVLLSVLISFVGVYASSLVKKSIPAVLVTYLFAFMLGFVLLITFIVLQLAAALAASIFPLVSFFTNPTLDEGLYYVIALTVTCAIYCTFLFISTTNRLKPTSHNKSTALRLFWTVVAIIVPLQVGAYFMVSRLPSHDAAVGTLILGAVYLTLLFLVPMLTAPAEPPLPSRRVRREMEKLPDGLMNGGGKIFFPGGARGAAHSAIVVVLGLVLMFVASWVCFQQLESRLDDKAMLVSDYQQAMGIEPQGAFPGAPSFAPAMLTIASLPDEQLREGVTTFYAAELMGILYLLVVLGVTLLVVGQFTWRMTLSGISKSLAGVLAGLLLAVWIVVPYIAQAIGGSGMDPEEALVAQFSPIQAGVNGVKWGEESGRAEITTGNNSERHEMRAEASQWRWLTFMGTAVALGSGLLALNVVSHRKIMKRVKEMASGEHALPQAVEPTAEQVEQAIQNVTVNAAPEPAAAPPPPVPTEQPPLDAAPEDLPSFDEITGDDEKSE